MIIKYKNISSKDYMKNWLRKTFAIDSVLKTNLWTHKIKNLNKEKIIGSFYEQKLLLSQLLMSYYPEPDSHIKDKFKVVLELTNATKKN